MNEKRMGAKGRTWDTTPLNPTELLERPAVQAVRNGSSLRAAAKEFGMHHGTLHNWIQQIRDELGDDWFPQNFLRRSSRLAKKSEVHTYPIYARVPAGLFNGSDQTDMEPMGEYLTDLMVRKRKDCPAPFAMEVRGHSMTSPGEDVEFTEGTRVLCDPGLTPDLGDFVVVMDTTDESLTLKRLINKGGANAPRDLWLVPLNKDYPEMKYEDDLHQIAGVVVDAVKPVYRKIDGIKRRR